MLFVRRKAEIEVLCAASDSPKLTYKDKTSDFDEDCIAPRQQQNTLTQYLVAKIGRAVDSGGARESSSSRFWSDS